MDPSPSADAPWRSGLQGARANVLPGIILQLVALALVLGYYNVAVLHDALSSLLSLRQTAGFTLGIVSTGFFGGVLPFLYLHFAGRRNSGITPYNWTQGLWLTLFWSYKGFEVDVWYRLQAHMFGSGHEPGTIVVKVIMDQFVYCPILAVPLTTAVYQMVDAHGNWRGLIADIRSGGWYRRRVLAILISNIGVWVPAVAVVYCLPTPLQLPLQNIVLCFYTLVVAHQIRADKGPTLLTPPTPSPGLTATY
jgi:hypothetical protein